MSMTDKNSSFMPPIGFDKASAEKTLQRGYDTLEGLVKMINESAKRRDAMGMLKPDTYGCERMFLRAFVNDEMQEDFPLIARDFLLHEAGNISEHNDLQYVDFDSGMTWPEESFNLFILNLMMNAVKSGSTYAKSLFVYLHKTYYKQEYKALKKFSRLSSGELIALSEPDVKNGEWDFAGKMARILCISEMYGIDIGADCGVIYAYLNHCVSQEREEDRASYSEKIGEIFQDCLTEIEESGKLDEYYALDDKAAQYLGNVLRWLGYGPEYADQCDENDADLSRRLAVSLAILKKTYPKKEFTPWEIVLCGTILHAASALTCNADWLDEQSRILAYGEQGTDYYDEYPSQFHPEEVTTAISNAPRKSFEEKRSTDKEESSASGQIEKDAATELEEARRQIHLLENENKELKIQLAGRHALEKENKVLSDKADSMTRELAALRNHVYHLTEDDAPVDKKGVDEMKRELAKRKIIIVGGHTNWVAKLKKDFPGWKFVNHEVSGAIDASVVENADYVYFFSDTLSHTTYYRYVNVAREKKVGYGYVHGVNIEKNVRQMYRELYGE
jgi:hypothetical protein